MTTIINNNNDRNNNNSKHKLCVGRVSRVDTGQETNEARLWFTGQANNLRQQGGYWPGRPAAPTAGLCCALSETQGRVSS